MARYQHLQVYQDSYRFVRELYRIKFKLPQALKHDLGQAACISGLRILKGITLANGAATKGRILGTVLLEVQVLWVYLRLLYELKGISAGEFEVLSALLTKLEPQIQNWMKWANSKNLPPKQNRHDKSGLVV